MLIHPVKRTRAYEEIVSQLADMVRSGRLKPGDRLPPERELAQAFGVGRPTLRQALTVLAQAGVVEVLPGSGVYLRKPVSDSPGEAGNPMAMMLLTEQHNLKDILELRVGIEGEAAYLAAARRTPEQAERLKAAFRDWCDAFDARGIAFEEDYEFHFAVAEATGNPVILKVMVSLADLFMQQLKETTYSLYGEPGRLDTMRQEHESILRGILEQKPEEAREATVRHLRRVFERLSAFQQGDGAPSREP